MHAGLTLHTSNRLERLLDALVEAMAARRAEGCSPLEPVTVAVPGPAVEAWLKLGLARTAGLFANVRLRYLSGLVADEVSRAASGTRVVEGPQLRGLLLRTLHDDALLSEPGLLPVRDYLRAGGEASDAVDRRRFQLAERLAQLFEEYGFSRAEMLQAWPEGTVLPAGSPFAGSEAWQRLLWLALFGPSGLAEEEGARRSESWLPLPRALDALEKSPVPAGAAPTLHLFAFSYLARSFHRLLALLARRADLHVYALNPCREFWEDVETPAERDRRLPRRGERRLPVRGRQSEEEDEDPFGLLDDADESPLLSLWGRPGREHARLLNELTDCDFDDRYEDPSRERPTLLSRVQASLLDRAPLSPPPPGVSADDATVRLLAAPSLEREAAAIAGEIRRLLDEPADPPLRLHEVAVVVPPASAEAYRAALASAFAEAGGLPWSALELGSAAARPVASAFSLLLGLPFTDLTRPDVLSVVSHPALLARIPGASRTDLARWCEELGIVRGADREELSGSTGGRDLLSWDQGLRRLALGAFLSGERSGESRPFAAEGERYLPLELPGDSLAPASAFALLVRSLLSDARHARRTRTTAAGWTAFLSRLLDAYLPAGTEEDERGRLACLAAIRALGDLPLSDLVIGYRIAYEAVAGALLGAGSGRRGSPLCDGVFVSTFVPVRAVPFRVVFAAGLDAKAFPARDPRDLLDLRLARRRAADVTPRERDQYLFLETLLSARERLVLSWVCVDPKTGEATERSPLVRELAASGVPLEAEVLPPRREMDPAARAEEPSADHRPVPAAARREARARLFGESLREHLGGRPPDLSASALAREFAAVPALASVPALVSLPAPLDPRAARAPETAAVRLTLSGLVGFLRCPVQASARQHLGLATDDDEELLHRDEEPFETPFLGRFGLLRGTFAEALERAPEGDDEAFARLLEEGWERGAERLLSRAQIPAGALLARERREHLALLRALEAALRTEHGALPRARAVRLGRADPGATAEEVLDPVVLEDVPLPDGRRVRVEVHGATRPLLAGTEELLEIAVTRPSRIGDVPAARAALSAFVEHAALAASGARPAAARDLLVLHAPGRGADAVPLRVRLGAISRPEALAWLSDLAADLLAGASCRLLPWEAILRWRSARESRGFGEVVRQLLEDTQRTYDFDRGPVPRPHELEPVPDDEVGPLVARRFGPFLSRVAPAGADEEDDS